MLRIRRYLRPYLPGLAIAIVLLFIQANLDLALPDYLSQLVNTGIQQNGVETPIPQAMRQETMTHLALFLEAEDESAVRDAYDLIEPGSDRADDYVDDYPLLADEPIYVVRELTDEQVDQITLPVAKALLLIAGLEQAMANPRLPPGTDLFALLGRLPAAQRRQISDTVDERFTVMGDAMVTQSAVVRVKSEYEALGMDVNRLQNEYIMRTGGVMLIITLLSAVCTVTVGYLSARIAAGTGRDLRSDVFGKVESFSSAEFDRFPTASLITRSTNDITQLQMVTMIMVRLVFYAPIMGIGGTIRAIGKGSSMWWTIAVAVLVLLGVITVLVSLALPRFRLVQKLTDRINLVARENLSGMMVIRAFNMEDFEEKRFDRANEDLTANTLFIARVMAVMMPVMMFILNVLSVVILWVDAH